MRLLVILCAAAAFAQTRPPVGPPNGYELRFSDEFDGAALDMKKWMYRTDVKASSSQRPENVSVEGGRLVLHMRKEDHRGMRYTGSGVITRERFRYGYFEARAKMFGGSGWHQSVWSMFAGDGSTTYPEQMRTEIDGMEYDSGTPLKGHIGLIIWEGSNKRRSSKTCSPGVYQLYLGFDATADFHTYAYEWTPEKINFFLDGELRCTLDYSPSEGVHDAINFWLTAIALEGRYGNVDPARLPGRMEVDYARVYTRP